MLGIYHIKLLGMVQSDIKSIKRKCHISAHTTVQEEKQMDHIAIRECPKSLEKVINGNSKYQERKCFSPGNENVLWDTP